MNLISLNNAYIRIYHLLKVIPEPQVFTAETVEMLRSSLIIDVYNKCFSSQSVKKNYAESMPLKSNKIYIFV